MNKREIAEKITKWVQRAVTLSAEDVQAVTAQIEAALNLECETNNETTSVTPSVPSVLSKVECWACGDEYPSVHGSATQAIRCAATIESHEDRYYIVGHYGSKYDLSLYEIKIPAVFLHLCSGVVICDSCITSNLSSKVIELIDDDLLAGGDWRNRIKK